MPYIVANGMETEHSPILFPIVVPVREMHQGRRCPMKHVTMTYLHNHLHTTSYANHDSLNVTAEDESKNDVGQQPPYVLQATTSGQRFCTF